MVNIANLRIEGVYGQRQAGNFMLRVKVPGGVLSSEQALKVSEIAERFAGGAIHLTTRASIEFHWLKEENLAETGRMLAAVGLTTRGACGGAVRGIVCNTPFAPDFPTVQILARKLHHHFSQNPHFENLPKKFKIGVDASYVGSRHLIQDLGLVYAGNEGGQDCYDVWTAGGLGREPQPAFLMAGQVPEARLIPLIEGVIDIYRRHTPAGKRLKHLVREIGRDEFLRRLDAEVDRELTIPLGDGFDKCLTTVADKGVATRAEAMVFAGELTAEKMRGLSGIAASFAGGYMVLTCEQNVAFILDDKTDTGMAAAAMDDLGFIGTSRQERINFRICPGNHECKMGLAPTRDISRAVIDAIPPSGEALSWAMAGCPNSCSQPQLAQVGIIASRITKDPEGKNLPRFDIYRMREENVFAEPIRKGITLEELLECVRSMD